MQITGSEKDLVSLLFKMYLVRFEGEGEGGGWPYLHADAALQLELQPDHVHVRGGAEQPQLGHLAAHLIDGHLDGAEVSLVLVHDRHALLHVGKAVRGCGGGREKGEGKNRGRGGGSRSKERRYDDGI